MVNTELLKQRKNELNLSYDDITARSGCSRRSIIRIFKGDTPCPRIDTLQKIAEVLELPIEELTTDNDYKVTEPLVQTLTPFKQPENNQSTANLIYLKQRKKELNLTFEELSLTSGVPLNTITDIFRGITKNPRIDTMQAIERALGIDNKIQAKQDFILSDDEKELIIAYRRILPSLKQCSKELIVQLADINKGEKANKKQE